MATPEVVILGIQSSGKTVCLSVLGRKYMIAGGSDRAEALGFRMEPNDTMTRRLVIDTFQKFESREWPDPTKEINAAKLSWNVYTGRRQVFTLATMDCSGEDIRNAFAPGKGDSMAADGLLGTSETLAENRQREIREAVFQAGLVCLFINVGTSDDELVREEKRRNFKESVRIFWGLLNDHPDIAKKSLVVLTQTHLLREEIQSAGGAFLYLGQRAPDLQQVVDRHKVPMICISAVNESSYNNKRPPETIESDGLFGFLLSVAGLVSDTRSGLLKLKDSYFTYLKMRNEVSRHLRNRSPLPERVDALRSFVRAADTFYGRCLRYVRKSANLAEPKKELPFYEDATRTDAEVREASELWRSRLAIDEEWYSRLLSLAREKMAETNDVTPVFEDEELWKIGESIRRDRKISTDASLYGFDEKIFGAGVRYSSYRDWIKASAGSFVVRIRDGETQKKKTAAVSGIVFGIYLSCGWLLPWSHLWYVACAVPFLLLFLFFLSCLGKKGEELACQGGRGYYAEAAREKLGELASHIRGIWNRISLFCCKSLPNIMRKIPQSKAMNGLKTMVGTGVRKSAGVIRKAFKRRVRSGMAKTLTLPGGEEMRFRLCPPGTFTMGEGTGAYRVTLTRTFWMGETPVTQKQWESVMGKNPSCFKGDDRPVEGVSWEDCQEFIQKVNAKLLDGQVRLPTEAEWEYACRAGTTTPYGGTGNLDEMGWYGGNSGGETHPVGQKKPNAWGLYDMHGNVWEWCADWFGDYPSGSVTDPTGPSSGETRVRRGGSWSRSASRSGKPSDSTPADNQGVRVVLVPEM